MQPLIALGVAGALLVQTPPLPATPAKSVYLERISWQEAERILTPEAVVVFALGNASKEHGPHLPLSTDFIQAQYVLDRIVERTAVVVAPALHYGFYPPFLEYPGSTTLPLSVARDEVTSICRSYARASGARRFYVVNHGIITRFALEQAATELRSDGILLRFTDLDAARAPAAKAVLRQAPGGQHADESETSLLLYMAPDLVDMRRAVKEYGQPASAGGRMVGNRPMNNGQFSPSGVVGDPTLATREKGRVLADALVEATVKDIDEIRHAALPDREPMDAVFARVVGEYESAPNERFSFARDGELLVLQRPGKSPIRLQFAGAMRFGLWTIEARFIGDDGPSGRYVVVSEGGKEIVARRIQ